MVIETGIVSLMTISLFLNATTVNQGNHCIITFNQHGPAIDVDNQALLGTVDSCAELAKNLQQQMQGIATVFFGANLLGGT